MNDVLEPIKWLTEAGFPTYIVGNQSRSHLLNTIDDPKDIDITTKALPSEVKAILRNHRIIVSRSDDHFGSLAFVFQNRDYEITTFRKDIYDPQFDHIKRAPSKIIWLKTARADALRRDFTINAIYWNPLNDKIIDPFDGQKDLRNKTLKFIGNPIIRIKEDPVRALRAIRFKNGLGLKYDKSAKQALVQYGHLVHHLSLSVRKKEYAKIMALPNFQSALKELRSFGMAAKF